MKMKYIIIIFLVISIPATFLLSNPKFDDAEKFIDNNSIWILLIIGAVGVGYFISKSKKWFKN